MRVGIIGAGASGMMAAITAARENKKVCILEKLDKVGKKLLATGNGKCNFTNANMHVKCFGGDEAFIKNVLEQFYEKENAVHNWIFEDLENSKEDYKKIVEEIINFDN